MFIVFIIKRYLVVVLEEGVDIWLGWFEVKLDYCSVGYGKDCSMDWILNVCNLKVVC